MIRKQPFIWGAMLLLLNSKLVWPEISFSPRQQVIDWTLSHKVYEDPVWLKLLHTKGGYKPDMRSSVISQEFFLGSDPEAVSPKQELLSAINAFYEPATTSANEHALCRLPARAYWLASKAKTAGLSIPQIKCPALDEWANWEQLESIGLIMASGYFGNPASSFGHVLIKVNNSGFDTGGELLEKSINFGAVVPPKEPALIYVLKGLFGGYVAGFSDKKFYLQDMIYSRTEFRDIWEYELALSDYQKNILLRHLWELVGQQYVYYFLKQNCAYRVAELLELTSQSSLIGRKQVYLPTDLFQGLVKARSPGGDSLVKQIRAYPSAQRQLYDQYENLLPGQQESLNQIIKDPTSLEKMVGETRAAQRLELVEAGLAHYDYKIGGLQAEREKGDSDAATQSSEFERIKRRLVLQRLELPAGRGESKRNVSEVPDEPTKGNGMRLWRLGVVSNDGGDAHTVIGGALAYSDLVGHYTGGLENTELKVLDLQMEEKNGDLELDFINLASVSDLNPARSELPGENSKSWRLGLGARKATFEERSKLTGFVEGGLGKSFVLGRGGFLYGMFDLGYEGRGDAVLLGPAVGFAVDLSGRVGLASELRYRKDIAEGREQAQSAFGLRWSLFRNHEIRFDVRRQEQVDQASIRYHKAW